MDRKFLFFVQSANLKTDDFLLYMLININKYIYGQIKTTMGW